MKLIDSKGNTQVFESLEKLKIWLDVHFDDYPDSILRESFDSTFYWDYDQLDLSLEGKLTMVYAYSIEQLG